MSNDNHSSDNASKPQMKKGNGKAKKDTGKCCELDKSPWHNTEECWAKQSLVAEMKSSELNPDSNSETEPDKGKRIIDVVRKYPTYDIEMYSIVQAYWQWKHYILGKETVIHTDHKPLQFMQTQGKLQNDRHQKWSTYLQQFHLNIKYKKGSTNQVPDCLSRPPVATLTTVLNSCGHDTSEWSQLYSSNSDFAATYQLLAAGTPVVDFYL